jgi:hypothetical protein
MRLLRETLKIENQAGQTKQRIYSRCGLAGDIFVRRY